MNSNRDQIIEKVIEKKNKINSNAFTLTRLSLLALHSYFLDGLQYRELKTALQISDGNLVSNLNYLIKMGYLIKNNAIFDNRKIHFYIITKSGREELDKIIEWIDSINKLLEDVDFE